MGHSRKTTRIAIIDDDALQVEILASYLADIKAEIATFSDAEAFYKANERFELVITDLNLPNDTGFEVCSFIKEKKTTADTYIIFISSVDDAETVSSAYACGANGYLAKPIIPVEFICQVESLLKQSSLSTRLKHKSKQAKDVAKSSMLESERLQLVINFVQDASDTKNFYTMAKTTFKFMSGVGLAGSIMFHYEGKHHYFADDGKERELEQRLMLELWKKVHTDANQQTRFFSSRGRVAASFDNCSIFIRRITSGQEDSLLDFLGLFMNQLDKVVERVSTEQKMIQYLSDASQIITAVDQELSRIEDSLESFADDQCSVLRAKMEGHAKEISNRIARLLPQKSASQESSS